MPRGIPKGGFRKTKNWQKRQPEASEKQPEKQRIKPPKPKQEVYKSDQESEKIGSPIQKKRRKVSKNKTPDSLDDATSGSSSRVGKMICAKLEAGAEGCCVTESAFSEIVGGCEFCDRETKPVRVLIVTSARNPKTKMRICRRCLSICATARLEL